MIWIDQVVDLQECFDADTVRRRDAGERITRLYNVLLCNRNIHTWTSRVCRRDYQRSAFYRGNNWERCACWYRLIGAKSCRDYNDLGLAAHAGECRHDRLGSVGLERKDAHCERIASRGIYEDRGLEIAQAEDEREQPRGCEPACGRHSLRKQQRRAPPAAGSRW